MLRILQKGVSLRVVHIWQIVITVVMSAIVIFSTYRLTVAFLDLKDAANKHIELESAARELMDASDFLTESVQRFTINGDRRFLDDYFREAFETNRREEAIDTMRLDESTDPALKQLQEALNNSLVLMDREYYAMRLVIEAKGYTDYPEVLNRIKLSDEDKALSADEKMQLATKMVLDDEYYDQKDRIRTDMKESVRELDKLMREAEAEGMQQLHIQIYIVRVVIVLQTLSIIFMVWLTSYLGINPILQAVNRIKEDSPIPVTGANEFRYLAQAYNKMYLSYRKSLEKLNFKASHDELTGAYNRAGYDILISSIDLQNTYMMLFDVDNFKNINDTYGHETGDQVLVKLVQVLKSIFRDDDCICRIGGDEFVVFMVHSGGMLRRQIEAKIEQINDELENTTDGLPPISISVGVVHGKDVKDRDKLLEKTDKAMYEAKRKGKHTYAFYSK